MTRRVMWWIGMQVMLLACGGALALAASDVPLPPRAEGVSRHEGMVHTLAITTTLFQTTDTPAQVVAFYQATLPPQQWQLVALPGIEQVTGPQLQVVRYQRGDEQIMINAQHPPGQSKTVVTVGLVHGKPEELVKYIQAGGNVVTQVDGVTVQGGPLNHQAFRDVLGIPPYPGAQRVGDMHQPEMGSMDMAVYSTSDAAEDVINFYRSNMPFHGWHEAKRSMQEIKGDLDRVMQGTVGNSESLLLFENSDQLAMITLRSLPVAVPGGNLVIGVGVSKHPQRELKEANDALRR